MIFSKFGKKTPEKKFWEWFTSKSEDYFANVEINTEQLFFELDTNIHKINQNLVYQFSEIKSNGKREFVISADGLKELIPIVQKLVADAPKLDKWEIIAFRQRQKKLHTIEIDNFKVYPDDIYFYLTNDGGKARITLFVKNYIERKEYVGAIFTILDNAVGEYDAMTKILSLEIKVLDEKNIQDLYPLKELPEML